MKDTRIKSLLFFAALMLFLSPIAEAATITVNCPGQLLQAAVDIGQPGDVIQVTGTCNENILIRNEKQRLTLDGGGTATINGGRGSPTVNVRGKGISIRRFTITGGSDGIHVNRGSNAVIDLNTISTTGNNGILVDQLSFAVITTNNISQNPHDGIFVRENSAAHIGFNLATDTSASPNTIQNNVGSGIEVANASSARITGNTISMNGFNGIAVFNFSQASISSNIINSNDGSGIFIGGGIADLGNGSTPSFFDQPNSTTVNNAFFGIQCNTLGFADGKLGTLNGLNGAKSFPVATCFDSTTP